MTHDIRYAIRTSLRRPAFTTLIVATLGVGIGANTAMFSIVESVLIEPLPFERPEELVYLYGAFKGGDQASISPPDFLDYRARQTVFSAFAARTIFGAAVLSGSAEPERVQESIATANFFATLGVRPLLGRGFLPAEERGSHDVAILSYGLWQRRFAGRPDVVGTTARIDGRPHTIVGVMPPVVDATFDVQVWRPVPFGTSGASVRRFHYLRGLGRLAPGVTLAQAQRQLDVIARQLEQVYPENETWRLRLVPYRETVVGDVGRTLVVLLTAEITLPETRYPTRADAERFWTTFTERLRGVSGVERGPHGSGGTDGRGLPAGGGRGDDSRRRWRGARPRPLVGRHEGWSGACSSRSARPTSRYSSR
jgi:putative ABC transport system permease protein